MISLIFILQLKMYVNKTNQDQAKELSHKTPIFALFYSHFCGHCKKVYPTWTEMMTYYENDTSIITAETDCVDHPKTCNYFFRVSGYPTFAYIVNGVAREVMVTRTLEKFKEFVESLKKIDPQVPCQMWFSMTDVTEYPIFVYSSPESFTDACKEASNFINNKNKEKIYIDSQYDAIHSNLTKAQDIAAVKRTVQLEARYDRYRKALLYDEGDDKFKDVDRYDYISKMIQDHSQIPLTDFKEEFIRNSLRRVIILLYMEKRHINQFKDFAYANINNFLFTSMNITAFKKKYKNIQIEISDAPALFISNEKKNNFMILKQQNSQDLTKNDTLNKIINGQYENQMTITLKDINMKIDNNININNNEKIIVEQNDTSVLGEIFLILGMILIIGVLFTLIFSVFNKFCRTRKIKKRNYYLDKAYKGGCHKFLQFFDCTKKDVLL
ncbi:hypothetical protein M9Y10_043081 [Tritrichomonas musculus]|uniref:Thioredoxin domain-containing protein n=1 Tax=Tritrichomonas musculus TaxID=1915356 RepID=A0ABR2JZC8_9EUKA